MSDSPKATGCEARALQALPDLGAPGGPFKDKASGADLFADDPECDPERVDELVAFYKRHGFCVISPCVPAMLTEALLDWITRRVGTLPDNRGDGRVCLNDEQNLLVKQWFDLLVWLVDEQSMTAKVMNRMFGDAWWFDICGGDVVRGKAGFASPCMPHSDWKGVPDGVVCISVFLHDVSHDNAPMMVWSRSDGRCYTGVGRKGSILIRCVDTIHSGSQNHETGDRVLPAYRFVTSAALRQRWTPRSFVSEEAFATFTPPLRTKCIFLRNL